MEDITSIALLKLGDYQITIGTILVSVFILLATYLTEYIVNRQLLKRYFVRKQVDIGRSFAITQFLKYVIYVVGALFIIRHLAGGLSILALGSASLLVGIGFGLQQTFNDFLSGIILLVDRVLEVGDIVVVDNIVGKVSRIGLRVTEIYTRDRVFIIVPNSKIVGNNLTNWSTNKAPARFSVDVGVAYKSNIDKVEQILLDCCANEDQILLDPKPAVQLINFGNSSIDFRVLYYSHDLFSAEFVKSDLRKRIFKEFLKQGIEIPFPQQDIYIKSKPAEL